MINRAFCIGFAALGLMVGAATSRSAVIFDATGTFAGGQSLGGTVTIDTVAGTVQSVAITVRSVGAPSAVTETHISTATQFANYFELATYSVTAGPPADLLIPVSTLVGYTGGTLASTATPVSGMTSSITYSATSSYPLTAGALTPEATSVPEPASFAVLSLCSMLVLSRRRQQR